MFFLRKLPTRIAFGLAALLVLISIYATFYFSHLLETNKSYTKFDLFPAIFILIGVLILAGILWVLYKSDWLKSRYLSILLLLLVLGIGLATLFFMPIKPVYDNLNVNREIYDFLSGQKTEWAGYFYTYPQNVNIVSVTVFILAPFAGLLTSFSIYLVTMSWVGVGSLIGLSIWLFFEIRKFSGPRTANLFLLLFILIEPIFANYFMVLYTDRPALIFGIAALIFLVNGIEKKKWYYGLLFSITAYLSFAMRANFIILLVVAGVVLLYLARSMMDFLKQILLVGLVSLAVFGSGNWLLNSYSQGVLNYETSQKAKGLRQPLNSWFLIGYNYENSGRYGQENNDIINKYQSYQRRSIYISQKLGDRIQQAGFLGTLSLYFEKINVLLGFTDFGIGNYTEFRGRVPDRLFKDYVEVVSLLGHIALFLSEFGLLLYVFHVFRWKKETSILGPIFLVASLGFLLFYILIWEVQESYGLPSIFMLMPVGALGLADLFTKQKAKPLELETSGTGVPDSAPEPVMSQDSSSISVQSSHNSIESVIPPTSDTENQVPDQSEDQKSEVVDWTSDDDYKLASLAQEINQMMDNAKDSGDSDPVEKT